MAIRLPTTRPIIPYGQELVKTREVIADALRRYPDAAMMWSTGKDSTVVLHECLKQKPDIPVYFIDAHEFYETYQYLEWCRVHWKLNLKVVRQEAVCVGGDTIYCFAELTPDLLYDRARKDFDNINKNLLWWTVMKTFPLQEQVKHDALITGMRWDEDTFRGFLNYEERFDSYGATSGVKNKVRFHPLLHFSEFDSHKYLKDNKIKVHPLYAQGYRSLGDKYTTTPSSDGTERGGRNQGDLKTIIYMAKIGYLQSLGVQ